MPTIDIRRKHTLSATKARNIVQMLAQTLSEKHGVVYRWEDNILYCERAGIKGVVSLAKHELHVHIELGRLFGDARDKMQERIERFLDQNLPASQQP